MFKIVVLGFAMVGAVFCSFAYNGGMLWHDGIRIAGHLLSYAMIGLCFVAYAGMKLHSKG